MQFTSPFKYLNDRKKVKLSLWQSLYDLLTYFILYFIHIHKLTFYWWSPFRLHRTAQLHPTDDNDYEITVQPTRRYNDDCLIKLSYQALLNFIQECHPAYRFKVLPTVENYHRPSFVASASSGVCGCKTRALGLNELLPAYYDQQTRTVKIAIKFNSGGRGGGM